jgi:hypothetical protein
VDGGVRTLHRPTRQSGQSGKFVLLNMAIVLVAGVTATTLLRPSLAQAAWWRATVTPLASIIGSGFLVLGPILTDSYGQYSPLVMASLCLCAYLFGAAIRYNIATIEAEQVHRGWLEVVLEDAASWALAFAYVISVAYYLNLLGAFAVSLTPLNESNYARLVTTAVYVLILGVGWFRGFQMLESLEYGSVTAKLAIISGLLLGLAYYLAGNVLGGNLMLNPVKGQGWELVALAFGLLITVQGFETSRYLGKHYSAAERIRSMRLAQGVTTTIYMVYILLIAYDFDIAGRKLTETSIIDMMRLVAPILPALLVVAALSAQFSAAIADTSGAGGLFTELTHNRIGAHHGYAILVGVGLALTWTSDVFLIISYASRAFAIYYSLQASIASVAAYKRGGHRRQAAQFALLAGFGVFIAIFGRPAES